MGRAMTWNWLDWADCAPRRQLACKQALLARQAELRAGDLLRDLPRSTAGMCRLWSNYRLGNV